MQCGPEPGTRLGQRGPLVDRGHRCQRIQRGRGDELQAAGSLDDQVTAAMIVSVDDQVGRLVVAIVAVSKRDCQPGTAFSCNQLGEQLGRAAGKGELTRKRCRQERTWCDSAAEFDEQQCLLDQTEAETAGGFGNGETEPAELGNRAPELLEPVARSDRGSCRRRQLAGEEVPNHNDQVGLLIGRQQVHRSSARESEDAVGDDVALDVGGSGADRRRR